MSEASVPVMERLKSETVEQHDAAENHPFHRQLAKGRVSNEQYTSYLRQMYCVHRGLEEKLREVVDTREDAARIVTEEQFQTPYLADDLRHFGIDPSAVDASAATQGFLDHLRGIDPQRDWGRVLGMHYVLEGSNNGSRFIAKNLSRAQGWESGAPGMRYLDPYGDRQREVWLRFKERMNAVGFSDAQKDEIVDAAKVMFGWIAEISDDLAAAPAS